MEPFSRNELALAVVGGHHRRFCLEKPADIGEPGTKRTSQPIQVTVSEAPGSHPLPEQKLLKLSRYPRFTTRLVLQDKSLTAFSNSLVQYSKTFLSSYDAFFG